MLLFCSGCKTYDKFKVNTPPGTELFVPYNSSVPVGNTLSNSHTLSVPANLYCGYVIAKDPVTGLKIPYGLDVRKKTYPMEKLARSTGWVLTSAGIGTILGGTIVVIAASANEDDDIASGAAIVIGAGAAVSGLGIALGMPADARLRQLSHKYQFTYVNNQTLDLSGLKTELNNIDPPKGFSGKSNPKRGKASTAVTENSPKTTKSKKSLKNSAKEVSGTYSGEGKLMDGKLVEESYDVISVIIESIDKNHVQVRVIEDGEDFFESPLKFSVSKDKENYVLILDKLPSVKIKINRGGNLNFVHDKVNIDNQVYTLSIQAKQVNK